MSAITEIKKMLVDLKNSKPRKVICCDILVKKGETKAQAIARYKRENNIIEDADTDLVLIINYE